MLGVTSWAVSGRSGYSYRMYEVIIVTESKLHNQHSIAGIKGPLGALYPL